MSRFSYTRVLFAFFLPIMLLLIGCGGAPPTDVVDDIDPVRPVISYRHTGLLNGLAEMEPQERWEALQEDWPNLGRNLISYHSGQPVDSIAYYFGSMKAKVADAHGTYHKGKFDNELVAVLYTGKDGLPLVVRCLNGMADKLSRIPKNLQYLGSEVVKTEFTIQKGEGLCDYVDGETAILLAERFKLVLYKGKRQIESKRISPDEAMELLPRTDWIQITVRVFEGDHFDLTGMSFTRKGVTTEWVSQDEKSATLSLRDGGKFVVSCSTGLLGEEWPSSFIGTPDTLCCVRFDASGDTAWSSAVISHLEAGQYWRFDKILELVEYRDGRIFLYPRQKLGDLIFEDRFSADITFSKGGLPVFGFNVKWGLQN